jgi:hypothetical protein
MVTIHPSNLLATEVFMKGLVGKRPLPRWRGRSVLSHSL